MCPMSSHRIHQCSASSGPILRWAGEPAPEKRKVWVIARQHPGETMAEFFAEVCPSTHPFARCSCVGLMQIASHALACGGTRLACLLSCICCPGSLKLACAIGIVACSATIS